MKGNPRTGRQWHLFLWSGVIGRCRYIPSLCCHQEEDSHQRDGRKVNKNLEGSQHKKPVNPVSKPCHFIAPCHLKTGGAGSALHHEL